MVALPAYLATIAAHELIHYLVGRVVGLRGLRLVFDARRMLLGFTFREAPLRGFAAALVAPQLLTIALLGLYAVTGSVLALALGLANLAGGVPDLVNAFEALSLSRVHAAVRVETGTLVFVPRSKG